ncbi:UNKNOWN [Stylonychia lemnae]|uniref:Uncharacterized protein n=1 Tax=Stylonychia lemnae TaxID=5949 RepID=A0A078AWF4_STYLE|nr:UNKNOWN [Stylonychia lemnae]|eukprot:CDW85138.1 UNKNOWN [Stylonychia lemnae]
MLVQFSNLSVTDDNDIKGDFNSSFKEQSKVQNQQSLQSLTSTQKQIIMTKTYPKITELIEKNWKLKEITKQQVFGFKFQEINQENIIENKIASRYKLRQNRMSTLHNDNYYYQEYYMNGQLNKSKTQKYQDLEIVFEEQYEFNLTIIDQNQLTKLQQLIEDGFYLIQKKYGIQDFQLNLDSVFPSIDYILYCFLHEVKNPYESSKQNKDVIKIKLAYNYLIDIWALFDFSHFKKVQLILKLHDGNDHQDIMIEDVLHAFEISELINLS